jgi:hypothetical protein
MSAKNCPQCGAPLQESASGGLCPRCVMALNFKTETVYRDGKELDPQGTSFSGTHDENGFSTAQVFFNAPLSDIAHFRIGTRPIRAMEWKGVHLS